MWEAILSDNAYRAWLRPTRWMCLVEPPAKQLVHWNLRNNWRPNSEKVYTRNELCAYIVRHWDERVSKGLGGRLFLSTKRTDPPQDAINRRFNWVLTGSLTQNDLSDKETSWNSLPLVELLFCNQSSHARWSCRRRKRLQENFCFASRCWFQHHCWGPVLQQLQLCRSQNQGIQRSKMYYHKAGCRSPRCGAGRTKSLFAVSQDLRLLPTAKSGWRLCRVGKRFVRYPNEEGVLSDCSQERPI